MFRLGLVNWWSSFGFWKMSSPEVADEVEFLMFHWVGKTIRLCLWLDLDYRLYPSLSLHSILNDNRENIT